MTVGATLSIVQFVLLVVSAALSIWMYRKYSETKWNSDYSRVKRSIWLIGAILFGLWAALSIISFCAAAMV